MMRKEDIAEMLLDIGAVSINSVNPFKYANGMTGPIYTNCRILVSYPKERKCVIDSFVEFIDREIGRDKIDIIVGTASSGISFAAYIADRLKLPMAYIRATSKTHGKGKQIEGIIKEGSKALLISDIISTEQDIPISVKVLKENKCDIVNVFAIMNNNLGIVETFLESEKIKYYTLTDLHTLLIVAHVNRKITSFDRDHVIEWMRDFENWQKIKKDKDARFSEESKVKIAKSLLKLGAVSLNTKNPYVFTSGILSPVYTDCRLLMSYPKEWNTVIDVATNIIANEIGIQNIDAVGATATAGISHATCIAQRFDLPMVYIKTSEENGEKKNKIEGLVESNKKVVIIEDLISTGGSLIDSVHAVRNAGGIAENCLSIFNYGMKKAKISFEANRLNVLSLSDLGTLLDVAIKQNYIKNQEKLLIQDWIIDPVNWGKKSGI